MMIIDSTDMCSHLRRKLFEEDGIYHRLWLAIQEDPELTAVLRHKSSSHSSCAAISTVSEKGLLGECFKMLAWPKCKSAVK